MWAEHADTLLYKYRMCSTVGTGSELVFRATVRGEAE